MWHFYKFVICIFSYVIVYAGVNSALAQNTAPIATADSVIVIEGSTTLLDVLSNDTDDDISTVSMNLVTLPDKGRVALTDNQLHYTAPNGFVGETHFTYQLVDSLGFASDEATVSILVTPLGQLVNGYYEKTYTKSGLFIVPDRNDLIVTVVGGGGAGSDGGWFGGCGGGGGGAIVEHAITLPPGAQVPITIGAGAANVSEPGGDSSFGDYLVGHGGKSGIEGVGSGNCVGTGGQFSGTESTTQGVAGGDGGQGGWTSHDENVAYNGAPGEDVSSVLGTFTGGAGVAWSISDGLKRGGNAGGGASALGNGGNGRQYPRTGYQGV